MHITIDIMYVYKYNVYYTHIYMYSFLFFEF